MKKFVCIASLCCSYIPITQAQDLPQQLTVQQTPNYTVYLIEINRPFTINELANTQPRPGLCACVTQCLQRIANILFDTNTYGNEQHEL